MFKKITAIFSSVLILLLVAALITLKMAPAIAVHFANQWYSEQGDDYRLEVSDWRFIVLRGKLELSGVTLYHPNSGAEKTALGKVLIDIRLKDLIDKKVALQQVELEGLRLDLAIEKLPDHQDIELAGLKLPMDESEAEEEPTEDAEEINLEELDWQISLQKLAFKDLQVQWHVHIDELNTEGAATLQKLHINDFFLSDTSQPKVDLALSVDRFALNDPQLALLEPVELKVNGRLKNIFSNPSWTGDLSVNNAQVEQEEITASIKTIALKGIEAGLDNDQVKVELANFNIEDVAVTLAQQTLNIADIQLLGIGVNGEQQKIEKILVSSLNFVDPTIEAQANIKQITLDNLSNAGKEQKLHHLMLQELSLTSPEKELISLKEYQFTDLILNQLNDRFSVNLGSHQYAGLMIDLERNQQGELVGLTVANEEVVEQQVEEQPQEIPTEATAEENSVMQALAVALLGFLQQGTEGDAESTVSFKDYSVKPRLKTHVQVKRLEIGEGKLMVEKDNHALGLEQSIPISLELGIGNFNTTDIDANLSLYKDGENFYPQGNIKLKVRKLDIVDFNGYLIEALGYQLDRGSLDIDADITIHEMALSGEVKILLRNSKFTPANEETISRVSKQISMPLDMAIGLLRDKNGNVHLNLPLEGRLDDPDFGMGDITRQISNKALKASTLFVLKQSLQPYGTMLTVASFAGDYLFAIRLDALQYVDNEVELSDDHKANLTKVGELMQSKKKIEVRACPFVNEVETVELGDDWADLARARGQEIKQWFEEHFTKESERLTLCRPQKGKTAEVVLGVN